MTNLEFLRQINKKTEAIIINQFIEIIKDTFGFKDGYSYIDNNTKDKREIHITFENALIYPHHDNDYYTYTLFLSGIKFSYILKISFLASEDFTEELFYKFLSFDFKTQRAKRTRRKKNKAKDKQ